MFLKYRKCILNTSFGQVKLNSKYFKIYLVLRLTTIKKKKTTADLTNVKLKDILFTDRLRTITPGGAKCTIEPHYKELVLIHNF